jgi:hypothetical protein
VLLKADVTANDATDRELMNRFGIFGPPAILFFGADGDELRSLRLLGYVPAERFAEHVREARGRRRGAMNRALPLCCWRWLPARPASSSTSASRDGIGAAATACRRLPAAPQAAEFAPPSCCPTSTGRRAPAPNGTAPSGS